MKWIKGIAVFLLLVTLLFISGLGVAVFYKKEILDELNAALKSALQADVQVGDADFTFFADFPNLTLRLEQVKMRSTDTTVYQLEFFKTERLDISIRTYKLLFKEVHFRSFRIEDGEIFVFRNARGYSNIDGLKRKETDRAEQTEGVIQLLNGKVFFERCRVVYADFLKRKYFSLNLKKTLSTLSYTDSVADFTLEGAVDFEALQFNPSRGSFLKETSALVSLNFRYYLNEGQLFVENSAVTLEKSQVNLKGHFDFAKARKVTLTIRSDNLHYKEGLRVIPESLATGLSVMDVEKPFRFILNLEAPLIPNVLPYVDIEFVLHDNVFRSREITITHLSLNGTMTNHVNESKPFDNQNSMVQLNDIKGQINDLPFQAEASLVDLSDIELKLHSTHKLTLRQLNKDVDTTRFRFLRGQFSSEFTYQGKLNEYLNESAGSYLGKLKGSSAIENGSFLFVTRNLTLNKINAYIRFTEDSVWINNLSLTTGKSTVQIGGLITNFVPFFVQPLQKGIVKLEIRSPSLDLASVFVKKKLKKSSARQKKIEKKKVSDMLDGVFRNLQFDVGIKVDKLKNGNFNVSNMSGRLRMTGTTLEARDLKMNYGGGQLSVHAVMKNLDKDVNPVEVTAKTSNVRIRDLFLSFDNFNQKVITDENLQGTISLNSTFKTRINDDFIMHMPSLRGHVNMTIRNGRLINVAAFRKMSNFLFKRRDFDDVKFAQINGKFGVSNRDLDISRMEIQSTVLSLFLEGTYSLDDRANLTIQVPLSNLRKRDKSYVPKNVGIDAKVGPSVFLRAVTNAKGETDISYDLFRDKTKKVSSRRRGKK